MRAAGHGGWTSLARPAGRRAKTAGVGPGQRRRHGSGAAPGITTVAQPGLRLRNPRRPDLASRRRCDQRRAERRPWLARSGRHLAPPTRLLCPRPPHPLCCPERRPALPPTLPPNGKQGRLPPSPIPTNTSSAESTGIAVRHLSQSFLRAALPCRYWLVQVVSGGF
ncbi:unnamed protein product [Urochloa humidicola]